MKDFLGEELAVNDRVLYVTHAGSPHDSKYRYGIAKIQEALPDGRVTLQRDGWTWIEHPPALLKFSDEQYALYLLRQPNPNN